jgi:hypothetical protein
VAKAALRELALVNHLSSVEPLGQPSQVRGISDGGYFVWKLLRNAPETPPNGVIGKFRPSPVAVGKLLKERLFRNCPTCRFYSNLPKTQIDLDRSISALPCLRQRGTMPSAVSSTAADFPGQISSRD